MAANTITNTYEVLRNLIHDGKEYNTGSTVLLTEEQANWLSLVEPPVIQLSVIKIAAIKS